MPHGRGSRRRSPGAIAGARLAPLRLTAATAPWLLAVLALRVASADDWPRHLGPGQDGISRETGWRKDWPEGGPPRLFQVPVGEGYSGVSVARGHLILFHRLSDDLLVDDLDPATAERRWRFAYPTRYRDRYGYNGGPRCAPAIDVDRAGGDSRVFALGPTGVLHALDLATGSKAWERDLPGELSLDDNFFGAGAAPVVEADRIFLNLGGTEMGTGMAFALEKATGRTIWKAPTDGGSYAAARTARIDADLQLFIFHRGGLSSFDPADGRERWKLPWRSRLHESVNASTPVVAGDVVFCSAAYRTGSFALRVRGDRHDVLWKDDLDAREKALEAHWDTPVAIDGHLYGFSGRHESEAELRCVELATGRVCWRWPSYLGRGSMVWSDGHAIALGERGDLALLRLSPRGHEEVRRVPGVLRWPAWTPPTLANGVLYLRDESTLIALDLRGSGGETKP